MAESLQDKTTRLRNLLDEQERLVAHLADVQRKLAAEAPGLAQVKDLLARQRRDVLEKSRAADRKTREHPDSPGAVLERTRVEKVRTALEAAYQDVEALLARLAKPPAAPSHATPVTAPEVVVVPVVAEVVEGPLPPPAEEPAAQAREEDHSHRHAEPAHEAETEEEAAEKALAEAIQAARQAMESLDRCRELAHEVARGGAWHAIAGAAFAKSPDRAKIDNVSEAARKAREDLERFHRQVAALETRFGGTFHAGGASALAELVSDAILWPEGGEAGAGTAVARLCRAYHDVRKACTRMQLYANRLRVGRMTAERHGTGAVL